MCSVSRRDEDEERGPVGGTPPGVGDKPRSSGLSDELYLERCLVANRKKPLEPGRCDVEVAELHGDGSQRGDHVPLAVCLYFPRHRLLNAVKIENAAELQCLLLAFGNAR